MLYLSNAPLTWTSVLLQSHHIAHLYVLQHVQQSNIYGKIIWSIPTN